MHDMDRTTRESEYGSELQEIQPEQFEFQETGELGEFGTGTYESGYGEMQEAASYETEPGEMYEAGLQEAQAGEFQEVPLQEADEMELAAEFLEITNEQELEQFLGKLFRKVGRVVGRVVRSPIGKAIGGVLKPLAKTALPLAGKAVGGFFGGPIGAMVGGKLASVAGQAFGLELEGMSNEDREFEVARRFVRLASSTTSKALAAPPRIPPQVVARKAVLAAARQHAPGIIRTYNTMIARPVQPPATGQRPLSPKPVRPTIPSGAGQGYPAPAFGDGSGTHGIWVRRGRRIIVVGV